MIDLHWEQTPIAITELYMRPTYEDIAGKRELVLNCIKNRVQSGALADFFTHNKLKLKTLKDSNQVCVIRRCNDLTDLGIPNFLTMKHPNFISKSCVLSLRACYISCQKSLREMRTWNCDVKLRGIIVIWWLGQDQNWALNKYNA